MATRVGTSGWKYDPWRGDFYPAGLTHKRELAYAAERFGALEINGTFYSLQRPELFERWASETRRGFRFAVKGGRFITHMKKLKDVEIPLANFFASGVLALEEKLGPILWQFPAGFGYDADRFDAFFALLPRDTFQAAELAKKHDARLDGRARVTSRARRRIRHAFEIRHPSFLATPRFLDALKKNGFALVTADTAGKFPYAEALTTDFAYVRLHGSQELYKSGYTPEELDAWARKLRRWEKRTRDVWCFFDNTDDKLRAPHDASDLIERLR